ncbi:MAG: hypothetical protein ACREN2_11880 [Candidatus Dormibacteria bacterium]
MTEQAADAPEERARRPLAAPEAPWFSIALVVFGVLDAVAPYASTALGQPLNTLPLNEVIDHVVPGALVIGVAWFSLIQGRRSLVGSLLAVVAGTWMVATHIPLLVQAGQGLVPVETALLHSVAGILVFVTAAMAAVVDAVVAMPARAQEPGD